MFTWVIKGERIEVSGVLDIVEFDSVLGFVKHAGKVTEKKLLTDTYPKLGIDVYQYKFNDLFHLCFTILL